MITPMQAYSEMLTDGAAKDASALLQWKQKRAFESLYRAREHSTFYAKRFSSCLAFTTEDAEAWQTVPTMTAEDLFDPFSLLSVPARDVARIISLSTTGTLKQKRILFSRDDLERTVSFFAHGMSTMVEKGQHVAVLMRGMEPDTIGNLLQKGLAHIGVTTEVIFPFDDTVTEGLKNADCLVGLPVPMLRLARKYPHLRPETVLLSADYVPQSVIKGIEQNWKCRVLTHYGSTETGYGFAVQCLFQKGYHMRDAEFLCEILDPQTQKPMPVGEYGEVVLTTLTNRAMPLIRYRTGDLARLIAPPCDCGAPLLTLDKVLGRLGDEVGISMPKLDEAVFFVETVFDMEASLVEGRLRLYVDCIKGTERETAHRIKSALNLEPEMMFQPLAMRLRKRRIEVQNGK